MKSLSLTIIAAVLATTLVLSGANFAEAASPKHQYGSKTITKMQNTEFINAAKRITIQDNSPPTEEKTSQTLEKKWTAYPTIKKEQLKNDIKFAEQQKALEKIAKMYSRIYPNLNF